MKRSEAIFHQEIEVLDIAMPSLEACDGLVVLNKVKMSKISDLLSAGVIVYNSIYGVVC